jgi:hypothetical protein
VEACAVVLVLSAAVLVLESFARHSTISRKLLASAAGQTLLRL